MKRWKDNVVLKYIWKYKWRYIIGLITLYLVDYLNLYIPQYTGEITDGLATHSLDLAGVVTIIGMILGVAAALAFGRFLWRVTIFGAARKVEYELRKELFAKIETLSTRYFNENKTGDLMSRFTSDIQAIRNFLGGALISAFDSVVMTVLIIYKMMTYVDVTLTLIAVIPMVFIAVGGYYFGEEIEKRFARKQEAFADLSDMVQESVSGARVIKAFAQESEEADAFAKVNNETRVANLNVVKLHALFMPLLEGIVGISYVISIIYGGRLAVIGQITLGRFIAFNTYLGTLVWPMIAIGDAITSFSQGKASVKRIMNIMDETPDIVDDEMTNYDIKSLGGQFSLNHLTFQYKEDLPNALEDVSVDVLPGETLAILGRTGAGKTTLVNLLERLYEVSDGMISFDGHSIREIPLHILREQISYVPQDNFLFSDTLANNISFGITASKEDIVRVCELACVHDNIIDFPEGYETVVGERGVTLSGGQKQRCSIARALLKDAPILILDDSLSAVDTDTEERILAHLKEERKGKTTIIIAHRISSIVNADHVLILKEGKVAEYGTQEELMNLNGIFRDMYEKQQLEKQLEGVE